MDKGSTSVESTDKIILTMIFKLILIVLSVFLVVGCIAGVLFFLTAWNAFNGGTLID